VASAEDVEMDTGSAPGSEMVPDAVTDGLDLAVDDLGLDLAADDLGLDLVADGLGLDLVADGLDLDLVADDLGLDCPDLDVKDQGSLDQDYPDLDDVERRHLRRACSPIIKHNRR
jgi:hypothetical protein